MNFAKKSLLAAVAGLMLIPASSFAAPEKYEIDTKGVHSFIQFRVKHMGISYIYGRFNKFQGDFTYDSENQKDSTVNISVTTNSVDTGNPERDKHLVEKKEFLESKNFPEATFKTTEYVPSSETEGEIKGNLTIKGVTKPFSAKVTRLGFGETPRKDFRAGFEAVGPIKLADYGIEGYGADHADLFITLELIKK